MFGTRWLATLFGFAFFSHQVGGFLGVWLGGLAYEVYGLLHAGLDPLDCVWRGIGDHQSADRRETGRTQGAEAGNRSIVMTATPAIRRAAWQSIPLILVCGSLIAMLGFGPRSTLGFFLTPMSAANGWGRDVFALALALQMLLWGAAQPFIGAIADRFGPVLVLSLGACALRHRFCLDDLCDHAG